MIISINVFQTISLIALLLPTTKLVLAQDDRPFDNNNHFLPPWTAEKTITTDPQVWSKNPVYALGSRMTVSWTSNYSIVSLVVAKDGTSQTWWIALNTAHQGSFSANVNLNDFEPFDPTLLGQGTSVWYFAIAEGDGSRPSLEGQYFYSRYFNLTGSSKSSSSPSPSSGSSSGTKSVITAVRTLTASAIQTVVQKIPSSSSSISSTRAVPLPSSSTFQIFSAEADANEGGGGNQITIVSFQTSTNPQARQTSVSISTLLSTETFNQDTTPQPKATSSAIASTSNKDKMTLYGGGIGGGLACVALIFGIAYLVLRHRTKKRLKEEQESSCTELDTRNMRFDFSPSIQDMGEMDSPTLPAVARPETSTSFGTFGTLGTSILFPTFTDDVGERSTSHWSD